jgi:hypothetical protein
MRAGLVEEDIEDKQFILGFIFILSLRLHGTT